MKKVVEFFSSALFLPFIVLAFLSIYWLVYIPSKAVIYDRVGFSEQCLAAYFALLVLGKLFLEKRMLSILFYIAAALVSLAVSPLGMGLWIFMFMFGFYRERPVFAALAGIVVLSAITYNRLLRHDKRQILIFLFTLPIFIIAVFNFVVYCPKVWAAKQFAGYRYYVTEEIWDYPHSDTRFYKCKLLGLQCRLLEGTNYGHPGIIVDEEKKEVSLVDARGLRYTDGANPRTYAHIEGGLLEGNLYYLAETCNNLNYNGFKDCEYYTFVPYECNRDNQSCDPLPIRIKSDYESYFYWETDEARKEISLRYSDDEILIFKYGEQLQCYAEGCEILQQK